MKNLFLFCCCLWMVVQNSYAQQEKTWFYIIAKDTSFQPEFFKTKGLLHYQGEDKALKELLDKYKLSIFKKTYREASKKNLQRTFFVVADDKKLLKDLLLNTPYFLDGWIIPQEKRKIYEPNDYGLTSTIGSNEGAQVNLDYLDFLGVPKAWYYTTGSPDVIIGVSDGSIDTTDIEFAGKSKIVRPSTLSKGHGFSVSETIAGKGDNAYGIAGICYNCTLYTTSFGYYDDYEQLLELSKMGARVINCSWGTTRAYEKAQAAVDSMYKNGTLLVAAGHNVSLSVSKGERYYYPASYDKVIAVSSAMHRYNSPFDNILSGETEKGTYYYANNIKGYIGRNAGFRNNDTTKVPVIYKQSIRNLNDQIDILGPSVGIYRYSQQLLHDVDSMSVGSATSGVTPLITGTIGLMFSLCPCLPTDEVESILKITAWNIDAIEPNTPYKGIYGASMLQTGDAVEMVYQLYNEKETVYIEDQDFSRWDFKLTSYAKRVVMQNQKFTEDATLNLRSKKAIVIKPNTVLKPNKSGKIHLRIDPALERECDLVLRDPSILEKD